MVCKCKRIEEYWESTGSNTTNKYFTRKDLLTMLGVGAIPIIGQAIFIFSFLFTYFISRDENFRVKKKFREMNDAKRSVHAK